MITLLLGITIIEMQVLIAVFSVLFATAFYKSRIREFKTADKQYNEFADSGAEEQFYDEGFLSDMESFDGRIEQMKKDMQYDDYNVPAVEVITDDYEASMNA